VSNYGIENFVDIVNGKSNTIKKAENYDRYNLEEIIKWGKKPLKIVLKNKSNLGEDSLKLFFQITKNADLSVKCFDIKDEFFGEYNLGNIF